MTLITRETGGPLVRLEVWDSDIDFKTILRGSDGTFDQAKMIAFEGQIARPRKAEHALYIDVLSQSGNKVEVKVVDADLRQSAGQLRPGDTVSFSGFFDCVHPFHGLTLLCTTFDLRQSWGSIPKDSIKPTHHLDTWTSERLLEVNQSVTKYKNGKPLRCRYWINTKVCFRGENCTYFHDSAETIKQARREWVEERIQKKRLQEQLEDDHNDPLEKRHKRRRAHVFTQWLLDVFGDSLLSRGEVIDVAGGRGDVSFQLWNVNKVRSTIIDPRKQKLSKEQRRYIKDHGGSLCPQIEAMFGADGEDNVELGEALSRSTLVVGMHPDQATDSIVDVAIAMKKPFAVVPCCVFAEQFPHRRLKDNKPVRTYEDLIQYLLEKSPKIKRDFLNFAGRNQVLFVNSWEN